VDFVLVRRDLGILTLTARWKADEFEPGGITAFRYHYPIGPNWVVCHDVARAYSREFNALKLDFISLEEMGQRLKMPNFKAQILNKTQNSKIQPPK
jgi:hypothetical protein